MNVPGTIQRNMTGGKAAILETSECDLSHPPKREYLVRRFLIQRIQHP
jgi:hypothetical protein